MDLKSMMMVIILKKCKMYSNDQNTIKCRLNEIVIHRPNARHLLFPAELPGIKKVLRAKLLSVWLKADMNMRKHVDDIVHISNRPTYLLSQLKRRRLSHVQLQSVFDAIILARVLYASPALRGYFQLILCAT